MRHIDDIISESIKTTVGKWLLCEYGMKPKRMADKFSEVLDAIVDNLVCICLYPNNPAIQHWRERTCGLCKRFVDMDIDPIRKNNPKDRLKYLSISVNEVLNKDFSALKNHFKTVSAYYGNKKNPNERIVPIIPYERSCQENAERIKKCIFALINGIANQDYEAILQYMETF